MKQITNEERAKVLDPCCGSRMFHFDKTNDIVVFGDIRTYSGELCDGRLLEVSPDVVMDFTDMPFEDNSFYLVVFDPPHMTSLGANSWMALKYGRLHKDSWRQVIADGFSECMRVLKPNGTLIFKWNETDVKTSDVLKVIREIGFSPLFGHTTGRQSKTIWMTFIKTP